MSVWKMLDSNLERWCLALLMGGMATMIVIQVVLRYIFQNSLVWSEELVRWLFIWSIWVGIAYAFKTRQHIRITALADILQGRKRLALEIVLQIVIAVFFLWCAWLGWKQANSPSILRQASVAMHWPFTGKAVGTAWLYLSLPVGALLSVFRLGQNIAADWRQLYADERGVEMQP